MNHCCNDMKVFLKGPRDPIKYNPIFREYYVQTNRSSAIIILSYCPWCGIKLPKTLREKFFDALELEYNIDTNISECMHRDDVPKEFKSDEWWKNRGL